MKYPAEQNGGWVLGELTPPSTPEPRAPARRSWLLECLYWVVIPALIGILAALIFRMAPAFAQQNQPPSAEMQALQARVMAEINSNLQCSTAGITLQQEVAKLKAEIEALKKPKE